MLTSYADGQQDPTVSILMSVKDGGQYTQICIKSLQLQTFKNWELILIDDGSKDTSVSDAVLAFNDFRIRPFVYKHSRGLAYRLNQHINYCRGNYIMRIDHDDFCFLNRIQKQVDYLNDHPEVDLVASDGLIVDEKYQARSNLYYEFIPKSPTISGSLQYPHPSWMVRKSWLERYRYSNLRRAQDQELLVRAQGSSEYHRLSEALFAYRVHSRGNTLNTLYKYSSIFVIKSWYFLKSFQLFRLCMFFLFSLYFVLKISILPKPVRPPKLSSLLNYNNIRSNLLDGLKPIRPTVVLTNASCVQDLIGGSQLSVHHIATDFAAAGWRVIVLCPNRGNKKNGISRANNSRYTIVRYKNFKSYFRILNSFSALLSGYKIFSKYKVNLWWAHSPEPWLFLPFTKWVGEIIYTVHGPWVLESRLNRRSTLVPRILSRFIYRKGVKYHYQSKYTYKESLCEIPKLGKAPAVILPVLVDENSLVNNLKTSDFEEEFYLQKNRLNLLLPRRFTWRTGVIPFLRNLSELRNVPINVIVTGQGELIEQVRELCESDARFQFRPGLDSSSMRALYSRCDVVCLPSVDAEGFGISVLEALMNKSVVLHTGNGGMGEFLSGSENSYIFALDDLVGLEAVIKKLLRLKEGENLYIEERINYNFKENMQKLLNG